jgi:hypothetical protein
MSLYRLFGAPTASADSVASLDIRDKGTIESIAFSGYINAGASAGGALELSFGSTGTFATNDTTQTLGTAGVSSSGAGLSAFSHVVTGLAIPIDAGERIYLHWFTTSTLTGSKMFCHIYVADSLTARQGRTRR